jgi:hypothetical protein
VNLVADGDETAVEVQSLLVDVDVSPHEPEHLAATHPRRGGQPVVVADLREMTGRRIQRPEILC